MYDKFESRAFSLTIIVIVLFMTALLYAVTSRKIDLPDCLPYNNKLYRSGVDSLGNKTYQLFYQARMWSFEPKQVCLPVGSDVDIYLSSLDVVHGFNIYDKNVNMMAVPGGIVKTSIHFDKPGVYKVTCHEYCGIGHQNMQAEIIVNP